MQVLNIPAFNYFQSEIKCVNSKKKSFGDIKMKYIELEISKRAGFWRYKIEVELNLQFQPQAPYIKEIVIRGKSYYGITKTEVIEDYSLIILGIADSELYRYEDPADNSYSYSYNLYCLTYLIRPYRKRIKFYLEYNIDINKIIKVFEDLDDRIDKMMQAPGTPAFNFFQTETKYIKLKISKKAGFWGYKVEIELNLQPQPQAPYIKEIIVSGMNYFGYGTTKAKVEDEYGLIVLEIADSRLYYYEDPSDESHTVSYNLCPSIYLTESYQKKVKFYLGYDVDISKVIEAFKDLDDEIDKMVQAPGTPAFNYFLNETKYIKLRISKEAGFFRYKVEIELNLPFQPQASYIKEVIIRDGISYGVCETKIEENQNSIILWVANSHLYYYEDLKIGDGSVSYNLCCSVYLIDSYQERLEFYLDCDVDINEVINAFKNLDNRIDEMVRASGTPAFNYSQTETKYIKLKISKKAGFWRYKVEVESNLQFQLRVPYIKEINIKGMDSRRVETGVSEKGGLIVLDIVDSELYSCENPMDDNHTNLYSLYPLVQRKIEFYLKYDVDISKVISAFKDLDNIVDRKVQMSNISTI